MITNADNRADYFRTKDNDLWVAEAIWGHRIEEQPATGLLMEFLGIAEGMHRKGQLCDHTHPNQDVEYEANQSLQLRNILFNNPRLEEIQRAAQGHSDTGWTHWLEDMNSRAALGRLTADLSYLRQRFESFDEFVSVVRLLRRITLEPGSDRSWTTQFPFPIGPAAMFEHLTEKKDGFDRVRIFFTRTGELAYLLLTRADEPYRVELRQRLEPLFNADTARNRLLLRLISSPTPDLGPRKGGTYLPYRTHPACNRFAEDLLAVLRLNLPNQDFIQFLQPLLALHLYLYGLETANEWKGGSGIPPLVCEIIAPRSDLTRKAAVASYTGNDDLGTLALQSYLRREVYEHPDLQATLNSALDEVAKMDRLHQHLVTTCALKERGEAQTHQDLFKNFQNRAKQAYESGTAAGLRSLAIGCGLLSKRGTNRYRYAPTDDLLRTLVLANVTDPVEETEFLRTLQTRYSLVIGPTEAQPVIVEDQFEETEFKRNHDRLIQHLVGMGLARRMSDDCTYVLNPLYQPA